MPKACEQAASRFSDSPTGPPVVPAFSMTFRRLVVFLLLLLGVLCWVTFGRLDLANLLPFEIAIGSAVILSIPAALCTRLGSSGPLVAMRRSLDSFLDRIRKPSSRAANWTALGIGLAAALFLYWAAASQSRPFVPTYHDEHMHLVQMQMLARGRLWMPPLKHGVNDQGGTWPVMRTVHTLLPKVVQAPAVVLFPFHGDDNPHEEPVYNIDVAWPDDAPIVHAQDLGVSRDLEIARYYGRTQPQRNFYIFDRRTGTVHSMGKADEFIAHLERERAARPSTRTPTPAPTPLAIQPLVVR
jgi:hypothetical protein